MADHDQPRRSRNLTDEDIKAVVAAMQEHHACRFEQVTPDDMSFMVDLMRVYKETRSEVIKWIVRGIMYGILMLVLIYGYFKIKM